jgi:hypothetical protein
VAARWQPEVATFKSAARQFKDLTSVFFFGADEGIRPATLTLTTLSRTPVRQWADRRRLVGAPLPQVGVEEGDSSIPGDPRLLRVEGSEEVFFVQEGVAGGIVVDLRFCVGAR